MKVIVSGGRDFTRWELLFATLDRLHAERHFTALMQGGAKGADAIARLWATDHPEPPNAGMATRSGRRLPDRRTRHQRHDASGKSRRRRSHRDRLIQRSRRYRRRQRSGVSHELASHTSPANISQRS
jgi:YspA, cpYpsA-related SLOG family